MVKEEIQRELLEQDGLISAVSKTTSPEDSPEEESEAFSKAVDKLFAQSGKLPLEVPVMLNGKEYVLAYEASIPPSHPVNRMEFSLILRETDVTFQNSDRPDRVDLGPGEVLGATWVFKPEESDHKHFDCFAVCQSRLEFQGQNLTSELLLLTNRIIQDVIERGYLPKAKTIKSIVSDGAKSNARQDIPKNWSAPIARTLGYGKDQVLTDTHGFSAFSRNFEVSELLQDDQ